jgi:ligand-binding sensor domain-containing protein
MGISDRGRQLDGGIWFMAAHHRVRGKDNNAQFEQFQEHHLTLGLERRAV